MIEGVSVFAIVVVLFIVITVLMGVRQVPQGYNYTVERFSKYNKTLTPGLGLIFPDIDSIGHKLNVMEQVVDVPRQEIITKDNATVAVDGVARRAPSDAGVSKSGDATEVQLNSRQVHNEFNQERHRVTRQAYNQRRSAALAEWRALVGVGCRWREAVVRHSQVKRLL
jgi:regulator of protease activity HflC (stomatin/prohibitin superfamily)